METTTNSINYMKPSSKGQMILWSVRIPSIALPRLLLTSFFMIRREAVRVT